MSRAFQLVVAFAALALAANALNTISVSSTALTSASFANTTVSTVLDASATTNADYIAGWNAYTSAYFAPGTTNGTVYLFGVASTSTSLTKVGSRALNAYYLSNGTAAKNGDATTGTDAAATLTVTTLGTPVVAVGLGGIAIAYVAKDSTTNQCAQLYVSIYTGGSSSATVTKQVTSNVCTVCTQGTASTSTGYVLTVGNMFYENSTYYVSWTQELYTQTETSGGSATCAVPTATGTGTVLTSIISYLNGVGVSSTGSFWWASAATIYSATTSPVSAANQALKCGPSNYTNSTNIICVYKNGAALTTSALVAVPVATATGSPGTSATIATDTTAGTISTSTYLVNTYSFGGFVYSEYQQGYIVNQLVTTGATPTYANNLYFYNTTSSNNTIGMIGSAYTNAIQNGAFGGSGVIYSQGWVLLDNYMSAATPTYTFEYTPYLANGTTNGSRTTVATSPLSSSAGNYFIDANGALWFGGYGVDTGNGNVLASATIGKLVAQVYYSAGNIIASFFALLSVMIAALFAF